MVGLWPVGSAVTITHLRHQDVYRLRYTLQRSVRCPLHFRQVHSDNAPRLSNEVDSTGPLGGGAKSLRAGSWRLSTPCRQGGPGRCGTRATPSPRVGEELGPTSRQKPGPVTDL